MPLAAYAAYCSCHALPDTGTDSPFSLDARRRTLTSSVIGSETMRVIQHGERVQRVTYGTQQKVSRRKKIRSRDQRSPCGNTPFVS